MSYLHAVHFTLDEANSTVDEIRPMIEDMIGLKETLDKKGFDVYTHMYFGGSGPNGKGPFPPEMEKLVEIIRFISAKGVQIKGIDNGLIDFPHIKSDGEEIYLCWLYGEDEIQYWHPIPEGFAGRRNISEL